MNLLIDSKLCVTPHRIVIDDLPETDGGLRVMAVVIDGDDPVVVQPRRRNSRRAYRSAPAMEGPAETLRFVAPAVTGLRSVDVATPYGVRRDYRLDGETLYSEYVAKSAARKRAG